jgi:hypothetical protein
MDMPWKLAAFGAPCRVWICPILFGVLLACAPGCSTSSGSGTPADASSPPTDATLTVTLSGVVQKGPYVLGSSITVQELDATLAPTGKSYNITTADNEGSFSLPVNLSSQYVEVIASGFYFDELTNQLSTAPLTLRALADVTGGATVDVNLLTSISGPLVRNLVAHGTGFAAARSQAESAVLSAVGLSTTLGTSFSNVSLTGSAAASAQLLAASLVIEQYARSTGSSEVAQLSLILAQIGAAEADSGSGDATLDALSAVLCVTAASIDGAAVRANLTAYYASVGATVTIPAFEPVLAVIAQCAACVPPATRCSGDAVQTCSRTGSWSAAVACDAGATCIAGACTGVCDPGQKQCTGNAAQTCDDAGRWDTTATCSNQACASGACVGTCAPGATQCGDAGVETCDDGGLWGADVPCDAGQMCMSGGCPVCTFGSARCSGAAVQTCDWSGHWVTSSGDCYYACVGGACAGECMPGSTQCFDGLLETCSSLGAWANAVACPSGQSCTAGACANSAAVCTPNTSRCDIWGPGVISGASGELIQTCDASGQWGVPVCVPTACVLGCSTGDNCGPGSTRCGAAGLETCDDGGLWGAGVPCDGGACIAGGCVGPACTPGQVLCEAGNTNYVTCDSLGQWGGPGETCPNLRCRSSGGPGDAGPPGCY